MKSGIKKIILKSCFEKKIAEIFCQGGLEVAKISDQLLVLICLFCGGKEKLKYGYVFTSHKYNFLTHHCSKWSQKKTVS